MFFVWFLGSLLLFSWQVDGLSVGKFKSLQCTSYDKEYTEFFLCKIKAINRYRNAIFLGFRNKKHLASHLTIQLEIFKRANGWRPFLYNITMNLCDLLGSTKTRTSPNGIIFSLAFSYFFPFLKEPWACPFPANGTIEIANLLSDVDLFRKRFPVEPGEYAAQISLYHKGIIRHAVNGSVEYRNYKEN